MQTKYNHYTNQELLGIVERSDLEANPMVQELLYRLRNAITNDIPPPNDTKYIEDL